METDWSVEIGSDAPVIDRDWPGWVDLQCNPDAVQRLPEVCAFPPLGTMLHAMLQHCSYLLTTKCDMWMEGPADPLEFDSEPENSTCVAACYLDLLPLHLAEWKQFAEVEEWARNTVHRLRSQVCRNARVELVVREAYAFQDSGFGVTVYLAGCGASEFAAHAALEATMLVTTDVLCQELVRAPSIAIPSTITEDTCTGE